MIIRNTLVKMAASMAGAWIGNAIVIHNNKTQDAQKYKIHASTLRDCNNMAVGIGTISPLFLSFFLGKSMVNIPRLCGLALTGEMISVVATNHFLQKEQIKKQEEEHKKTQEELTKTIGKLNDEENIRIVLLNRVHQLLTEKHELLNANEELLNANQELRDANEELRIDPQNQPLVHAHRELERLEERIFELSEENDELRKSPDKIRIRLLSLNSNATSFEFNTSEQITDAPDYEILPEVQITNAQHSSLICEECILTCKPFNELYQPVVLKAGGTYNLFEYTILKDHFFNENRSDKSVTNPYTRETLTADMLNGTNNTERVLFRVNRNLIPQASQTQT